jgi:hypothetical protein
VLGQEGPLRLGQERFERRGSGRDLPDVGVLDASLQGPGADVAARHRVDLDREAGRLAQFLRKLPRHDRPQLHDAVARLALYPPGAQHHPMAVEGQVRRVEEVDLPDLGFQRIDPEGRDRGVVRGLGQGQLQLDAVGFLDQLHDLGQLLVREPGRCRRGIHGNCQR